MTITNGVFIEHGGADTNEFWDVCFTREQLAHAETETESNGISVVIDPATGAVDLNAGYVEDSPEGRDERSLWHEYEDLIVEALARRIDEGQGNDVFKREAAKGETERATRIVAVLANVAAFADETCD